jgi:hypothetical protein
VRLEAAGMSALSVPTLLSRSGTLARRMQDGALAILRRHEAAGEIPTNGRFVFYEAEGQGLVRKSRQGESRRGNADDPREQELIDALTHLRDCGAVPWDWLTDETRTLYEWDCAASVFDYVVAQIESATINPWGDEPPPLVLMESRSLGGVLRGTIGPYCCPMAATNGQVGGFLHTKVAPLLRGNARRVLYVGDADLQGNQIEANTLRVLERAADRAIDWRRIALTAEQIAEHKLEPIWKVDGRYGKRGSDGKREGREHQAIECEALGQKLITTILRKALHDLLPEPLADLWAREDEQREAVRAALERIVNGEAAP